MKVQQYHYQTFLSFQNHTNYIIYDYEFHTKYHKQIILYKKISSTVKLFHIYLIVNSNYLLQYYKYGCLLQDRHFESPTEAILTQSKYEMKHYILR